MCNSWFTDFRPRRGLLFPKLPGPTWVTPDFLWRIGTACPSFWSSSFPLLGVRGPREVSWEYVKLGSHIFGPKMSSFFPNCPVPPKGPLTFYGRLEPQCLPIDHASRVYQQLQIVQTPECLHLRNMTTRPSDPFGPALSALIFLTLQKFKIPFFLSL